MSLLRSKSRSSKPPRTPPKLQKEAKSKSVEISADMKQTKTKEKEEKKIPSEESASRSGCEREHDDLYEREHDDDAASRYHRIYDDSDDQIDTLGCNCSLCDKDLADEPEGGGSEYPNPAESAVLLCGHAFHTKCLLMSVPQEQHSDPPCIICASLVDAYTKLKI